MIIVQVRPAEEYNLRSDPFHQYAQPNQPVVFHPEHPIPFQLARESPPHIFPHNAKDLNLTQIVDVKVLPKTTDSPYYWIANDKENPALPAFLYYIPGVSCTSCQKANRLCIQFTWTFPNARSNSYDADKKECALTGRCWGCRSRHSGKCDSAGTCLMAHDHPLEPPEVRRMVLTNRGLDMAIFRNKLRPPPFTMIAEASVPKSILNAAEGRQVPPTIPASRPELAPTNLRQPAPRNSKTKPKRYRKMLAVVEQQHTPSTIEVESQKLDRDLSRLRFREEELVIRYGPLDDFVILLKSQEADLVREQVRLSAKMRRLPLQIDASQDDKRHMAEINTLQEAINNLEGELGVRLNANAGQETSQEEDQREVAARHSLQVEQRKLLKVVNESNRVLGILEERLEDVQAAQGVGGGPALKTERKIHDRGTEGTLPFQRGMSLPLPY